MRKGAGALTKQILLLLLVVVVVVVPLLSIQPAGPALTYNYYTALTALRSLILVL